MEAEHKPTTSRKGILVLARNLFFVAKIEQAAAQAGLFVWRATSAQRAVELAREHKPSLVINY